MSNYAEIVYKFCLFFCAFLFLDIFIIRRYLFTERCVLFEADLLPLPSDFGDNIYLAETYALAEPVITFRYGPAETDVFHAFRNDRSLHITCSNDKPHLKVEYERMYYRHLFFGKRDYIVGPTTYHYTIVVPEIKSVSKDK